MAHFPFIPCYLGLLTCDVRWYLVQKHFMKAIKVIIHKSILSTYFYALLLASKISIIIFMMGKGKQKVHFYKISCHAIWMGLLMQAIGKEFA